MKRLRSLGLALLLALALPLLAEATTPLAAPTPAPLTIERLMRPGGFRHAALSPDGRHVAAVGVDAFSFPQVLLIATADFTHRRIAGGKRKQEGFHIYTQLPRRVMWMGNELLVVDYTHGAEVIRLDGSFVREVGTGLIGKVRPDDPADMRLLAFDDDERSSVSMVDLNRKHRQRLRWPMSGTPEDFVFDDEGRLRVVTLRTSAFWSDATTSAHWFLNDAGDWVELLRFGLRDEPWRPWAVERAPGGGTRLLVSSRHERDAAAIYAYDPQTRRFGEPLAAHPSDDIVAIGDADEASGRRVFRSGGLRPQLHQLDGKWKTLQTEVDAALPDHVNLLTGKPDGKVLILSYSDRDPGRWSLLDTATWELRHLLSVDEAMGKVALRPMETLHYAAKDGLRIPAYLTRPAGSGPHPAVVLVHGGPHARDHWGFDPEVQLLASLGYAVLQPQFRGSTGFGKAFHDAGINQWGKAMQEDLYAGIDALAAQGVIDPKQVCIVGASYGGYAALWGLVSAPERFRCGVSLNGVVDLELRFADGSDTARSKSGREFLRLYVGDREADRERLREVSPLLQAARLRAPLLLVHGTADERVPVNHAKRLMKALDAAGRPYTWVPIEGAGHGLWRDSERTTYYEALVDFLAKHLPVATRP